LITDFVITGTQTLSSVELAKIRSQMMGSCFDEDSEELGERVRALFQDRGYFAAVVQSVRVRPGDPLVTPKPTTLEADVVEGQRFKLKEVKFVGNHVFSETRLRSEFPLRKGDLFERDKIAGGLESVSKLYGSAGFLDFVAIPETQMSDATIVLSLSVTEGTQYRMGKLEVFAKKEIADRLEEEWRLPEGAIFDATYVDKYINEDRSLLPRGFTREDVQVVRNCPEGSAEVRLVLDLTIPASQSRPKDVECEAAPGTSK